MTLITALLAIRSSWGGDVAVETPRTCEEAVQLAESETGREWASELTVNGRRLPETAAAILTVGADGLPRIQVDGRTRVYDPIQHALTMTGAVDEPYDDKAPPPDEAWSSAQTWTLGTRAGLMKFGEEETGTFEVRDVIGGDTFMARDMPASWWTSDIQIVPIQRVAHHDGTTDEIWVLARPLSGGVLQTPDIRALPLADGRSRQVSQEEVPEHLRRVLSADAIAMDNAGIAWGLYHRSLQPGASNVRAYICASYSGARARRCVELGAQTNPEPWSELPPTVDRIDAQGRAIWNSSPPASLALMPLGSGRLLAVVPKREDAGAPTVWLLDPTLFDPCLVEGGAFETAPDGPLEATHEPAITTSALGGDIAKQLSRGRRPDVLFRPTDGPGPNLLAMWAPPPTGAVRAQASVLNIPLCINIKEISPVCFPLRSSLGGIAPPGLGVLKDHRRLEVGLDGAFTYQTEFWDLTTDLTPVDLAGIEGQPTTIVQLSPYLIIYPLLGFWFLWTLGGIGTFIGRARLGRFATTQRASGFVTGLDSPAFFFGRAPTVRDVIKALAKGDVVVIGGPQRTGKTWLASVVRMSLVRLSGSVSMYRELPIPLHNLLFAWPDPLRPIWLVGAWLGLIPERPEGRMIAVDSRWRAHHDDADAWRQLADDLWNAAAEIYKESTLGYEVAEICAWIVQNPPHEHPRAWVLEVLRRCAPGDVRVVLVVHEADEKLFEGESRTPIAAVLTELITCPAFTALLEGPRLESRVELSQVCLGRAMRSWSKLPALGWTHAIQMLVSLSHLAPRRPSLWCAAQIARCCARQPYLLQRVGSEVLERAQLAAQRSAYPSRVVGWADVRREVEQSVARAARDLRVLALWSEDDLVARGLPRALER